MIELTENFNFERLKGICIKCNRSVENLLRLKNEVSSYRAHKRQCGHLHWPNYRLPPAVHMKRNDWPAVQHPSNPEKQTKISTNVFSVVPVEIKQFQDITGRDCAHHMMQKYMLWNTCIKSLWGDVQSQRGSFFSNALEPCTYRNIYVS